MSMCGDCIDWFHCLSDRFGVFTAAWPRRSIISCRGEWKMKRLIGGIGTGFVVLAAILTLAAFRPTAFAAVSLDEANQVAGGQHVPCGNAVVPGGLTCVGEFLCFGVQVQCPFTGALQPQGPGDLTQVATPCSTGCGNQCTASGWVSCPKT